jgi:hypothetical protein
LWAIGVSVSNGQELFPTTEPASTMPKNIWGIRQVNEWYNDINNRARYYNGFRLMYGATKNLTLMATAALSNHHFKSLPYNLTYYINNHHRRVYPIYPNLLEGVHIYGKYRLVSFDQEQKHFRIAVYGEAGKSFVAHTEAESNLMTDNTGYGGGLIFTQLYKRFAISFTWGFIKVLPYEQDEDILKMKFVSGNSRMYNLSLGYRLYPRRYDNYKDLNVNLYAEIINKHYEAALIYYDGLPYDYQYLKQGDMYTYNGFIENRYSDLKTSIQFILDSSTRIDLGVAVPIYSRSYLHDYPLVFFNFQKYFFRTR